VIRHPEVLGAFAPSIDAWELLRRATKGDGPVRSYFEARAPKRRSVTPRITRAVTSATVF
jgi:hypothetical protein